MIIIVLISLYALFAGLISGWHTLVKLRRSSPPEGNAALDENRAAEVLLRWQAVPSPAFRADPLIALGLALHGAGVLALGILGFGVTLEVWNQQANWFLRGRDALALFLLLSSLILTWDIIGHLLAQPLLGLIKVPANFAVGGQGLYYGDVLQTWGQFSHFSLDETHREVQLHPANCPEMVTFCLKPPDEPGFRRLVGIIQDLLPGSPSPQIVPGTKDPWVFFGLLMLTVYPFLLVGFWLAAQPGIRTVLYFGLAAYAATRMGAKLIRSYT